MESVIIESAVRATLIWAAVALVLKAMGVKAATARHAAWASVAVTMLLLPLLLLWGPQASIPVLPAKAAATPSVFADQAAVLPSPAAENLFQPSAPGVWGWPALAVGLYLLGAATFGIRLMMGTWRVKKLVGGAVLFRGKLTHPSCATPVTMGWLRPTVILPPDWISWPKGQLNAVLAHEAEHIRRRDPLWQWLALLNRAVFWFHPVAWWLERRLSALAEEACDAAVLSQGHDPREYSEYLLDLARSVRRGGARVEALGMAMPGAGLPQRIRQILSGARAQRLSRARLALTAIVCLIAGATFAAGRLAQAQPPPSFEVATIKPTASPGAGRLFNLPSAGRLAATNVSLLDLIRFAYSTGGNIEITGGPNWLDRDRFDMVAQAQGSPAMSEMRDMLQTLLKERFALKVHSDSKGDSVYRLVMARNDNKPGPGLKPFKACEGPAAPSDPKMPRCGARISPNGMVLRGASMAHLANMLSIPLTNLGRPVVDQTGLTGEFDIDFDFQFRVPGPNGEAAPVDPLNEGPSLFTALQEQLGLKLEPSRGLIEMLVIDSAEKPLEN
jgi:bla regulator protein BlaR1